MIEANRTVASGGLSFQNIRDEAARVWHVVKEGSYFRVQVISELFFQCLNLIVPKVANAARFVWLHIQLAYAQIQAGRLKDQNAALEGRIQQLAAELGIVNNQATQEKQLDESERNRLIGEREQAVLSQAALLCKFDRLSEKNQRGIQEEETLRGQNRQLILTIEEKDKEIYRVSEEFDTLRTSLLQADDYKKFRQSLEQFQEQYDQNVRNGGSTKDPVVLEFQDRLANLGKMTQESIEELPENAAGRIALARMLLLFKQGVDHLEYVSRTYYADENLRRAFVQCFREWLPDQKPIVQVVGT
jgi:hypothetical protein